MKKATIQIGISLLFILILSVVNFNHWFLMIGWLSAYGLFKAMDIYYEVSNSHEGDIK